MKAIPYIVCLFVLFSCDFGANRNTDEIQLQRIHVDSLNALSYDLLYSDIDSCLRITKQSERGARKLDYRLGLARSLAIQGNVQNERGKYDSAIVLHRAALDLRKSEKDLVSIGKSFNNISEVYQGMMDYDQALAFADSAFNIYSELGDYSLMSGAASNKAINFVLHDHVDSAGVWFRKSVDLSKLGGDRIKMLNSHQNYGMFLDDYGDQDSSFVYIKYAVRIAEEDSLLAMIPDIFLALGQWVANDDPPRASELYDSALHLAKKYGLSPSEEVILLAKIKLLRESTNDSSLLIDMYDSLLVVMKDNYGENRRKEFTEFETKYKTAESRADARQSKLRLRWYGLSFALVVVLLSFFMVSLIQKRKLAVSQREVSEQRIDALIQGQELRKIDDMLEIQEKERSRIASDLHDRLGSILGAVKLNFSSMEEKLNRLESKNDDQYSVVKGLIDEAATEVRRIAHDMASGVLAKFGLVPAVHDLKKVLESSGKVQIAVYEHGMDERLSGSQEISVYRVIQELVSNALKHGRASHIDIHFTRTEDLLSVIVEDDGVGFESKKAGKRGLGLENIENRVAEMNGSFTIEGNPKSGTTAIIEITV